MWSSTRSTRSCAATVAGRHSALSSDSRAWPACSLDALAFRPPSATPSARALFSHRERDVTALSPVLKNRAACGASPWSTSTTRVPRHSSGDSRAWVLKRPKCLPPSALRQRHPRRCRPTPKACATADSPHRRNAVNVANGHRVRLPPGTAALLRPPRAKSTSPGPPSKRSSTPPTPHPTTPIPAWAISSNTPAGASVWSLPTRARRQRPYVPCCAATARADTSLTVSSSITAIFRHRCARRQKSSCAMRSRHRRPSPPLRLNLASISAVWSVRFRSMRHLPSVPFCSEWAARDAATFRPRCGLSCARKNPSRAR